MDSRDKATWPFTLAASAAGVDAKQAWQAMAMGMDALEDVGWKGEDLHLQVWTEYKTLPTSGLQRVFCFSLFDPGTRKVVAFMFTMTKGADE